MTAAKDPIGKAALMAQGFVIPPGVFDLSASLDDAIRRSCAAPLRDGEQAHPIFAFIAALGGMGSRVGDVCRGLGLAFDSGAVLGRCRIDYDAPLTVDTRYDVATSVVALERKGSRRFGAADHLTLGMTVSAGGGLRARVRLTTIMPAPV
ncbi:hypothetical protein V474_06935 [Novosphingobium barchaimii LL02]|uniref:Uncharacterized protein n=1 Tax=Novosphingobium barchaimii LL02 TaxID=1114963 RepID=A0A0J8A587_9SPHN|nr:hypothetical protein [Novosphingobium barchaimii]KMS50575.1 hypothetical protein V474_06935 [Novosphingobium barchaimii LL02]